MEDTEVEKIRGTGQALCRRGKIREDLSCEDQMCGIQESENNMDAAALEQLGKVS